MGVLEASVRGPATANHGGVPNAPLVRTKAFQAVDQLIIFHQAIRVEASHF